MSLFADWEKFAVHQRRGNTGCIPATYEMILKAAGATKIDFSTFQEEFDLGAAHNNFGSVAHAVEKKYPWVHFAQKGDFASGCDKVAFIDDLLRQGRPVIVSLSNERFGLKNSWHMQPIVDATDNEYVLLKFVHSNGKKDTENLSKAEIARIHDAYAGGKEVAYLERLDEPPELP